MSEVMHDHRIDDAETRLAASGPASLSVREVLGHVWRLQSHLPFRVAPMIDAVDACVQLGARRQVLVAGLETQTALDRLARIAAGRAGAGCLSSGEQEAVEALQRDMSERLWQALTDWRRAGQRFTHLTRMLPAQLSPTWPTLSPWDPAQRHELERQTPAALLPDFRRAQEHHIAARRRSVRAAHELECGREERRRAEALFRVGQCSLLRLSQAWWQQQRQVESCLHADVDRLVPQHLMAFLAGSAHAVLDGSVVHAE